MYSYPCRIGLVSFKALWPVMRSDLRLRMRQMTGCIAVTAGTDDSQRYPASPSSQLEDGSSLVKVRQIEGVAVQPELLERRQIAHILRQ